MSKSAAYVIDLIVELSRLHKINRLRQQAGLPPLKELP
jgi:hypothetical protein